MIWRYVFIFLTITSITGCSADEDPNGEAELQELLDQYTHTGSLPGVTLYIKTPDHEWYLSSGLQDMSADVPMDPTTLGYPQSISKSFTAVSILKLQEEGKLDVDDKMNGYLPDDVCDQISNGNIITIRQLLNHTSGIVDYVWLPDFQADVFSGELFPMTKEKVLSYVYGKPAGFSPGTDFGYADTNYHLLAMIIDEVTGKHHGVYFQTEIIEKLNLKNTYYLPYNSPLTYSGKSYYYKNNSYQDITELQYMLTQGGIGGDGLLCETKDLAVFYRALLKEGTLLNKESLAEMKKNPISIESYGMGLRRVNFGFGGFAFGHGGGGLGGGGRAYYFPDRSATVVMLTNAGLLTDKSDTADQLWRKILDIAL